MGYDLGYVPGDLTVHLTDGSDFVQSIETLDGDPFAAGAVVKLVFSDDTEWPATITGSTARWAVDKTDVAALLAVPGRLSAKLTYTDAAGLDLVWLKGGVERD